MKNEGTIDKHGNLHIKRGSNLKMQECRPVGMAVVPHSPPIGGSCSDVCSQFGEPDTERGHTVLKICQERILIFTKFSDERE